MKPVQANVKAYRNATLQRHETAKHVATGRRHERMRALLLVLPLAVFLLVFFAIPLFNVLKTAVVNDSVRVGLPQTSRLIGEWDGHSQVPRAIEQAMLKDVVQSANNQARFGDAVRQLNADLPGFRSLLSKTQRVVAAADVNMISDLRLGTIDERWLDTNYWLTIKQDSHIFTINNILAAADLRRTATGQIERLPDGVSANRAIIERTFYVSLLVTAICVALGVPYALIAANASAWMRNLMLLMVLIPLWTSLLVRSAAWVVILQDRGIINSALVSLGIITHPLQLIYNRTGILLAMTQVLIPFMVLPTYSAIKAVPTNLMPAASSLGARPTVAFVKILLPLIFAGVVSGSLLVFMSAIGYYITPTLVGGAGDQMISSVIAFYATGTADWGRAAALGLILLCSTLVLYVAYARISKSNPLFGE